MIGKYQGLDQDGSRTGQGESLVKTEFCLPSRLGSTSSRAGCSGVAGEHRRHAGECHFRPCVKVAEHTC